MDHDRTHGRRTRTIKGTRTDATRALAAINQQTQSAQTIHGHAGAPLTVTDLVDWYLTFARDTRGLERSTIHGYHETFNLWLRPHIGHIPAEQLTPAQIDDAFGVMRNEGKSHSRMNNARSAPKPPATLPR